MEVASASEGTVAERRRFTRVMELEDKIKKLENENKKLLNKVHNSPSPERRPASVKQNGTTGPSSIAIDDLESGVLDIESLLNESGEFKEDEWLYVSPKCPPTPAHRRVTPHQWLSEGHYPRGGRNVEDIPSLDEVRKSLIFNIDEAENLSDDLSNFTPASNLKGRSRPSNKITGGTSQGHRDVVGSRQRGAQTATDPGEGGGGSVPVMRWKAKVPVDALPSEHLEEDQAAPRKWKVKQVPSSGSADEEGQPGGNEAVGEDVPVVKWKAKMPADEPSDIPVVKWKAKMPTDEPPPASDVPVVKWKAKMPADKPSDVPVVKWKAKMPADKPSDVPVVKWKAKMPADKPPPASDVPVVKWKAKMPADEPSDVPVVKWKAKVPQDDAAGDADVPIVKWKAKMPEENVPNASENSDTTMVRLRPKHPQDTSTSPDLTIRRNTRVISSNPDLTSIRRNTRVISSSPDVTSEIRRNTRVLDPDVKWTPEDAQSSDVPVVKWKAKMPEDNSDVPVVKRKARLPEDSSSPDVSAVRRKPAKPVEDQSSDVPVVKWKAKMPNSTSDVPMSRKKAKMPETTHQRPEAAAAVRKKAKMPEDNPGPANVPVGKWKAKMPQDEGETAVATGKWKAKVPPEDSASEVPVGKWKAKLPPGESSETLKSQGEQKQSPASKMRVKRAAKPPESTLANTTSQDLESNIYHAKLPEPITPPDSPPSLSPTHQPPGEAPTPSKPLSRRSSFSESRSPSPPSISPQVRMAMGSPILSRRTPSPSRGLAGSLGSLNTTRHSPSASPSLQQRHLQYLAGGQQSPVTTRSLPSPGSGGGQGSRLRAPRSQAVKTNSPLKGLSPPGPGGERKSRRMLPPGPSPTEVTGRSRSREKVVVNRQLTPTTNRAMPQKVVQAQTPQDTGDDDDSWLEGCY